MMHWMLVALALGMLVSPTLQEKEDNERSRKERAATLAKEALFNVERGRMEEALKKYREVLLLSPDWVKVRFDLARLCFESGKQDFLDHLQLEREADELRAGAAKDKKKLAEIAELERQAKEKKEKADSILEEAERNMRTVVLEATKKDHTFNAHLTLGHIHTFREKWEKAKASYEKALAMEPQGGTADVIRKALKLVVSEIAKKKAEEEKAR